MGRAMSYVMTGIVVSIIIALLGSLAVNTIFTTSTTGWSTQGAVYWPYLGLIVIVLFILVLLAIAVGAWMAIAGGGKKG